MKSLRASVLWSTAAMGAVFALLTVLGGCVLIGGQASLHAQTILERHGGVFVWVFARILAGYLLAGAVAGVVLHPLLSGRKAAAGTLALAALALLYMLTGGTHVLYGPIHSLVAGTRTILPAFLRQAYDPRLVLVLFGGVLLLSLLLWVRRLGLRLVLPLLLLAATGFVLRDRPPSARPHPSAPNFVLLASDSLRADHLGVNGYARDTSPHIDALARRGTSFSCCLVPTASTHESWVSLLSSTHPRTNGLRHMFPSRELVARVEAEQTWLPRLLGERGYATAAVGGWCGSTFDLFDVGFEDTDVSDAQNAAALIAEAAFTCHLISLTFLDNAAGRLLLPELRGVSLTRAAPRLTGRVADRIDDLARSGRPFFLVAVYHGTHLPYSSSYPYTARYTRADYTGRNQYRIDFNVDEMIQRGFDHDLSDAEQEHVIALYDGCVREFDEQVGRVVAHLERRGLLDHTIVGVWADHGDDLYEHGATLGHGVTLFGGDQANRVPAVFAGPGVAVGRVEERLVRSYDLAPTWARWLGIEIPAAWEGVDLSRGAPELRALLETSYLLYRQPVPDLGPEEQPRAFPRWDDATFIDEEFDGNFVLRDRFAAALLETKCFALREGSWKLIYVPGENGPIYRLFDLAHDPECRQDLRAAFPDVFERLRSLLPPEALWQEGDEAR